MPCSEYRIKSNTVIERWWILCIFLYILFWSVHKTQLPSSYVSTNTQEGKYTNSLQSNLYQVLTNVKIHQPLKQYRYFYKDSCQDPGYSLSYALPWIFKSEVHSAAYFHDFPEILQNCGRTAGFSDILPDHANKSIALRRPSAHKVPSSVLVANRASAWTPCKKNCFSWPFFK